MGKQFQPMSMQAQQQGDRPKAHVFKTYARLLGRIKPHWPAVSTVMVLTALLSLMSVLPQQLFGVVIDSFRDNAAVGVQHHPVQSKLIFDAPMRAASEYVSQNWITGMPPVKVTILLVVVASVLLRLLDCLFAMCHGYLMAKVGQSIVYQMRNDVYRHLQRLSIGYLTDRSTGDLMSRVVNDVDSLNTVVVSPIADFMRDFCRLGWVLYFCLTWDWRLTLAGFVITPVLLLVTFVFGRFAREAFRQLRQRVGELNTVVQENISGIRVIKGFGREDHEMARFRSRNLESFRQHMKVSKLFTVFRPMVDFFSHTGMVVIICYGAYRVVDGHLTPGTLIVFMPYARMLYDPIRGLSRFYNVIQQAVASVERVFEVMDAELGVQDAPDAATLAGIDGRVEFEDVSFGYSNGVEVLEGIDLQAGPGQMIAIVGRSGSGKTTLINLLLRFYDPNCGAVFVDGRDLRQVRTQSLRSQMAMVLQDPFLFNDTIRANISYGKLDASTDEIVAAAKAANAHGFIVALPEGYETAIGERGVRLSGGQKQRLSIARAVLADPRILILDEATSSVDTQAETLIQAAIHRLVENRTTFVIAHRLSTVLHAHKIIVLDRGRIVESGTHQELLAADKLYTQLYQMQFGGGWEPSAVADEPLHEGVPPVLPDPDGEGLPSPVM